MSGADLILENAGSLRWLLPELGWLAVALGLWLLAAGGRRLDRAAPWLAAAGLAGVLAACLLVRRADTVLLAEGLLALDATRLIFRAVLAMIGGAVLMAPVMRARAGTAAPAGSGDAVAARPGTAACARLVAGLLVLDLTAGTTDLIQAAALLAAWLLLDPAAALVPADAGAPATDAANARSRAPAPDEAPADGAAGRAPLCAGALSLAVFLHGAVWLWAAAGRTGPGAGTAAAGAAAWAAGGLAAAGGLCLLGRPLRFVLARDRGASWRALLLGLAGLAAGALCLARLLAVFGGKVA